MSDPKPCIICVAITGSLPTKANNPAVPITLAEQIEPPQDGMLHAVRRALDVLLTLQE